MKAFEGPQKWSLFFLGFAFGGGMTAVCLHLGLGRQASIMAGVATLMAFLWITEAINIYITALFPIVLFPLLGIMDMKAVAPLYMKEVIFLFIGAFLMAFAMERWNLHKRIALNIIQWIGGSPTAILLGFMISSWFLSMWILNTATVSMLLPAVLAVIAEVENQKGRRMDGIAKPYLLGIAYASSIGGITTLIGTAPNLVLRDYYNEAFPDLEPIGFATWLPLGLPVSIVLFVACFFLLRYQYRNQLREEEINIHACRKAHTELGPLKVEEALVLLIFMLTVVLWFTRNDLDLGFVKMKGWITSAKAMGLGDIKESTIAMGAAVLMFLIPSSSREKGALLHWADMSRLPFGVLFLFGGGFALAAGFESSGLSIFIGEKLKAVGEWAPWLIVIVLCTFMTFFTELTTNTSSTLLIIPILLTITAFVPLTPMQLLLPVTLSASCAFMLPVATPPNTIVFGSSRLQINDMMRSGIWLNIAGIIVISALAFLIM